MLLQILAAHRRMRAEELMLMRLRSRPLAVVGSNQSFPPLAAPARIDKAPIASSTCPVSAAVTVVSDDGPFCHLTGLARALLDAPIAFVALLESPPWPCRTSVCPPSVLADSFCRNVLRGGSPLAVGNAGTDLRTRENPWVAATGFTAWACQPLSGPTGATVGMLCALDTAEREWTARDLTTLDGLAAAAAGELTLRNDLALAAGGALRLRALQAQVRSLQDSLLPPHLPEVPKMQVAARYLPAADGLGVLGDFYDVFPVAGNRWDAVIGDVCGHGVEAATLTALARYTIRAEASHEKSPTRVLDGLNTALLAQRPDSERFLTSAYVMLFPTDDGVDALIASAGHTPVLLRTSDGTVREVGRHGLPLGLFDSADLSDTRLSLRSGDSLLLYTDGVVEARRGREQYGDERLGELLARSGDLTAHELARAVEDEVLAFTGGPHTDDIAVLALLVSGP